MASQAISLRYRAHFGRGGKMVAGLGLHFIVICRLEAAVRERPDVCLLDVRMPGGGIRAAERIIELVPGCVVVMITASTDDETLFAALRAGAVGYLVKDRSLGRLHEALAGVLDGEAAVPRDLTARVLAEFRRRGRPHRLPDGYSHVSVTSREVTATAATGRRRRSLPSRAPWLRIQRGIRV